MGIKYKLPLQLAASLDQAHADLEAFVEEQRDAHDQATERWQQGDKAQEHTAWLDELEELANALGGVPGEAG
jgi:hypothetical protein